MDIPGCASREGDHWVPSIWDQCSLSSVMGIHKGKLDFLALRMLELVRLHIFDQLCVAHSAFESWEYASTLSSRGSGVNRIPPGHGEFCTALCLK